MDTWIPGLRKKASADADRDRLRVVSQSGRDQAWMNSPASSATLPAASPSTPTVRYPISPFPMSFSSTHVTRTVGSNPSCAASSNAARPEDQHDQLTLTRRQPDEMLTVVVPVALAVLTPGPLSIDPPLVDQVCERVLEEDLARVRNLAAIDVLLPVIVSLEVPVGVNLEVDVGVPARVPPGEVHRELGDAVGVGRPEPAQEALVQVGLLHPPVRLLGRRGGGCRVATGRGAGFDGVCEDVVLAVFLAGRSTPGGAASGGAAGTVRATSRAAGSSTAPATFVGREARVVTGSIDSPEVDADVGEGLARVDIQDADVEQNRKAGLAANRREGGSVSISLAHAHGGLL